MFAMISSKTLFFVKGEMSKFPTVEYQKNLRGNIGNLFVKTSAPSLGGIGLQCYL